MILPFIMNLETAGGNEYAHLPVLYFYLDLLKDKRGPVIAHERYFSSPDVIDKKLGGAASGFTTKEMATAMPSTKDLQSIGMYAIPQDFEDDLISDYAGRRDCWQSILHQENEKLDALIRSLFSRIESDYAEKIEAVLCYYCPASLRKIAEEKKIPIIFNERTSFRHPMFVFSGYFDMKDCYGKGELEARYKRFLSETSDKKVCFFGRKEILALFMTPWGLAYLDLVDTVRPSKELGICAVGSELAPLENTLFSTEDLMLDAQKIYLPGNIVLRGRGGSNQQTALEFILDCRRIASVHSNMSFDAMLLGRTSCSYGNSPFAFMANKEIRDTRENVAPLDFVNFVVFAYFVPWELLRDEEYIRWRLSKPSEIEIYSRHLEYILAKRGLDPSVLAQDGENRLAYILEKQNVKADLSFRHNFVGNVSGHYELGRNVFGCSSGVLFENFNDFEDWGAWSCRKDCRIKFLGNEAAYSSSAKRLVFAANALEKERHVAIIFNGKKLSEILILAERKEFSIDIPQQDIKIGENLLEFLSSEGEKSPVELGINDDPRKLVIGFAFLKICDCMIDERLEAVNQGVDERLEAVNQGVDERLELVNQSINDVRIYMRNLPDAIRYGASARGCGINLEKL